MIYHHDLDLSQVEDDDAFWHEILLMFTLGGFGGGTVLAIVDAAIDFDETDGRSCISVANASWLLHPLVATGLKRKFDFRRGRENNRMQDWT